MRPDEIALRVHSIGVGVDITSGLIAVAARSAAHAGRTLGTVIDNMQISADYLKQDFMGLRDLIAAVDPMLVDSTDLNLLAGDYEKLLGDLHEAALYVARIDNGALRDTRDAVGRVVDGLARRARELARRLVAFDLPVSVSRCTAGVDVVRRPVFLAEHAGVLVS